MSELPETWATVPFDELNNFRSRTVDPSARPDQEFELYSVPSYSSGQPERLPGSAIGSTKQTVLPNDVLVCKINPRINRVWTVGPKGQCEQIASSEWIGFRSDLIAPSFAKHYFNSPDFRELLCSEVAGVGGSLTRAQPKRVAGYPVPIAPVAEQTRITDQLDTLLARIQACSARFDAVPALLKRFRQAVLNSAVVGELIESEQQSDTAEWQESTIGAIATDVRYGTSKKCSYEIGGHGVLRIPNIARYGAIDLSDLKRAEFDANEVRKLALQEGDLLVIRSNGSLGLVGMCSLVSEKEAGLLYAGYLMRLRVDRSKANPAYVQICISATTQRRLIEQTAKSTSGVNNLNAEELRSLPLTLPPLNVQEEIVRRVRVLFSIADRIESRYSAASVHLQRLAPLTLAKAFRGELVRQDANDEPASVLLQRIARTPLAAVKAPRGRPRNQQPEAPLILPAVQPHWSELPAGTWAASGQPDEHATTAQLIAVLKAWGQPMPQDQARLAAVLCLQPRLFTAALPAQDAAQWRRLVGAEAEPLPPSVAALQPAVNTHWRRALAGLRARGDLVVSGTSPQDTWALGPGADRMDTMGWPDGRAGWVAAYLRARGVEALLPLLSPAAVDFVHARAA